MLSRLTTFWNNLSLARRFALAAGPVLLAGMSVLGIWVSGRITEGVVHNTAALTVLYLDGIIAPLNDELAKGGAPAPVALHALDETFRRPDIAARVVSFRIWRQDGTLIFATEGEFIGQIFPQNPALAQAFAGEVTAEFDQNDADVGGLPSPPDANLIEIYAPIRQAWSGKIIAAAEVYQTADELIADLRTARQQTWLVVAASALAMAAALFRIVKSGSNTIKDQQNKLEIRLTALQTMANQNRDLRLRIQSASGRASSLNERYLRRISADLHDGPAQNLAVAALRLPRLATLSDQERQSELGEIRAVLDAAMLEIRGISRGLILPELEDMPLQALLERATSTHESRTQTEVNLATDGIGALTLDHAQNICTYRFVQEGLTNAFKHGGGIDQRVNASWRDHTLSVTVTDSGDTANPSADSSGLGLIGLRERVESLGGTFASGPKSITMTLSWEET